MMISRLFSTPLIALPVLSTAAFAQHAPSSLSAGRMVAYSCDVEETGGYSYQSDMIIAIRGTSTMTFASAPGSYTYSRTGADKATLTISVNEPDGVWNETLLLTFTSPTTGTVTATGSFTIPDYGSFPFTSSGTFSYLPPISPAVPPVADNFDDNSRDSTKWGEDMTTMATAGTLTETNARVQFTTTVRGSHDAYRPWVRTGSITCDQDWEMTVDVGNTVPLPATGIAQAGVGIAIVSPDSNDHYHQIELARSRDETGAGSSILAFWDGGGMNYPGMSGTASLRLVYRAVEKRIISFVDTDGPANGYVWESLSTSSVAHWGMTGSEAFRVAVTGNAAELIVTAGTLYADNFRITPEAAMMTWKRFHFGDTDAAEAADLHDADFDGISNLIEYASGLDPKIPSNPILAPGSGTSGLPKITTTGAAGSSRLRLEYVRRTAASNPGITYTPQFSGNPAVSSSWAAATGTPVVTPINTSWERVVIEDTAAGLSAALCKGESVQAVTLRGLAGGNFHSPAGPGFCLIGA